jgi:DNA-binding beta-propeller fold protein YncE
VANENSNNVTKLSLGGTTQGTFAVGTTPYGIAFDGANMWVANNGSNNVTKLSSSGSTLGTFAVGNNPRGVGFDGAHIWVANQFVCCGAGTLSKL